MIAALVQGGLIGTAMAVPIAHDGHDLLGHDKSAVLEMIVHGHDHDRETPEHEHSLVTAEPLSHYAKRSERLIPPYAASNALISSIPRISLSVHRQTDLCGPSPPFPNQTFVVLRI